MTETYAIEGDIGSQRDPRVRRVDPRLVERMLRSSAIVTEQSPQVITDLRTHMATSRWPMEERVAYYAILDGFDSADSIEAGTGLTPMEVSKAIKGLEIRGYVTIQKVLEPTPL